jgi:hypothetical protein
MIELVAQEGKKSLFNQSPKLKHNKSKSILLLLSNLTSLFYLHISTS